MLRSLTSTLQRSSHAAAVSRPIAVSSPASSAPLFLILRRDMSSSVRVPSPLVSVSWLKAHYPFVQVLDGSWHMPAEKQDPRANFVAARLPGAVFFDLDACVSKEGKNATLPHMLPSAEQLSRYMGELGVSSDK